MLSTTGKTTILTIWAVMAALSFYAAVHVIIDFKFTDLIPPGTNAYEYFRIDWEYIKVGFETTIYVENADVDWTSEEI